MSKLLRKRKSNHEIIHVIASSNISKKGKYVFLYFMYAVWFSKSCPVPLFLFSKYVNSRIWKVFASCVTAIKRTQTQKCRQFDTPPSAGGAKRKGIRSFYRASAASVTIQRCYLYHCEETIWFSVACCIAFNIKWKRNLPLLCHSN